MLESTQVAEFSTAETHWHNPMPYPVHVDLCVGPAMVPPPPGGYKRGQAHKAHLRVTWKPNEIRRLPSVHDDAIHDVRNGVIVGGLAPQLRKVGSPKLVLAEAVDADGMKKKEAIETARAALVAKDVAEKTLIVATAQAGEAQQAIDAAEKEAAEVAAAETEALDADTPVPSDDDLVAPEGEATAPAAPRARRNRSS